MANKLQERFPEIRTREQILQEIYGNSHLLNRYQEWEPERQELFLDMFTGARGVKVLYDSFFKIVFNPDEIPERLERLLSVLLEQKVKILKVLPNEGVKIADEGTLLIMDIVIQMEDGSIADVECQKIGYAFPGQRAACYSADLLMRQYRRVKRERKAKNESFSFRDIKNVYTIIIYEKSPEIFTRSPDCYLHRSTQTLNSGIRLDLLQEYIFINLDIYFQIHQNNIIENELDAWLMFLGTDRPEQILDLLDQYPWFEDLYRDLYTACRNTERVMDMFSEELRILDRNTVQYMIDEMEDEIRKKADQLKEKTDQLKEKTDQLKEKENQLKEKEDQLKDQGNQLKEQESQLKNQNLMLENVCRSFIAECQERKGTRDEAILIICQKTGMDQETAAEMVKRFWEQ